MFKTQIKWKLGALLLIAPLAMSVPSHADDAVMDPATGHQDLRTEATKLRDELKRRKAVRSADGDVYIFHQDGHFEYGRGKKSAKGMIYLDDYGRFMVKQKSYTGGSDGAAVTSLILKITSARKQSNGKIVKRVDTRVLDIKQMTDPDELRNEKGSENDSVIYIRIDGKRFD